MRPSTTSPPCRPTIPTVFEYFRKDLKRPATDAWVVAPSNGFNRIGESGNRSYGRGFGAGVILPKRLLAAALSNAIGRGQYEHLLRDNYETPALYAAACRQQIELHQMAEVLKLSVDDFAAHARSLASPDELSVYIARQLMRQLAPSLLWITLHDIDIAHSGAFSLYLDAIRRSDRLCARNLETPSRASRNTPAKPTCSSCPISDAIPTSIRRQRLPTPPHGRRAVAHYMDDGAGSRHSGKRRGRSAHRTHRSGSHSGLAARVSPRGLSQGKPLTEVV